MFQYLIIFASLIVINFVASTTVKSVEVPRNETLKYVEPPRTVKVQLAHKKASSRFLLGEYQDVCSGAILTPTWILTTAHNIDDVGGKGLRVLYETDPHKYNLQAYNIKTISNTTIIHKVKNQVLHPKWVSGTKNLPAENNLALLELEEPLKLSKDFKPFYLESLDYEESSETYNLPKHVFEDIPYKDQASTPILRMRSFTDLRCHNHPLDPEFMEERNCGHVCSIVTGSPLWEQKDRDHAILFGISQLEVLPCESAPISVFTSVTPFTKGFIRKHLPENETLYFITK